METLELDLHTHLVPGVDDGSRNDTETVSMARGLVALGVRRAVLTPHQFRCGNRFDPAAIDEHESHVRALLAGAGIALDVVAGAEFCLGREFLDALERDELFGFSHEGQRHLLAEFPLGQPFVGGPTVARLLVDRGFVPVLAHPERYGLALSELEALRRAGWRFQVNLPALVGRYGPEARRTAGALLARGWADFCGSDLHRPEGLERLRLGHDAYRVQAREVSV